MTDALLDGFADWLASQAVADTDDVVGHAEAFLDSRADAPVSQIDEEDVRAFLLEWCPRHLSLPAEESWEVCNAVGQFLRYLGETGQLRGGVDRGKRLATLASGLAGAMQDAMADPANYGMAKSLFAGIEGAQEMSEQELLAAMQTRIDEHNALPFEQRKALTDRHFEPKPTTIELPFLYVPPPEAEVATSAAKAALLAKASALHGYLGEEGVALTPKGNLKLADGRALVDLLETGDELDPTIGDKTFKTHSTTQLRSLMYLLEVFAASGAVRYRRNRLVPVKAWSRKSRVANATSLFQTVADYGVLSIMGARMTYFDRLHSLLDNSALIWLAGLLAPGARADFDDILGLNDHIVRSQFDGDEMSFYLSSGYLAQDLSRILDVLDMTGAIEWTERIEAPTAWGRRYWTGGTVAMTAFGRHVLPPYLPEAGIVLRTAGDFTQADVTELIAAMDSQPQEQHSEMLAAWQPTLSAAERAGLVAAAIAEADDAHTRLAGLHVLGMFDADAAEPHMRQLLDTAAAGHAALWLLDHGLADGDTVGAFITPAVMVDLLSLLVDHPDALCQQFLESHDPEGLIEFFWRHSAPETAAVLDALGRHLPDRTLAKQARKAAIKHRSWLANGGR